MWRNNGRKRFIQFSTYNKDIFDIWLTYDQVNKIMDASVCPWIWWISIPTKWQNTSSHISSISMHIIYQTECRDKNNKKWNQTLMCAVVKLGHCTNDSSRAYSIQRKMTEKERHYMQLNVSSAQLSGERWMDGWIDRGTVALRLSNAQ